MSRIEIAPEAEQDGRDIADYLIRAAGLPVAQRYLADFEAAISRLAQFPGIGAPRPHFGPTMRMTTVAPYVIFYRYTQNDDTVRVVRVLHGRRNITAKLFPPK